MMDDVSNCTVGLAVSVPVFLDVSTVLEVWV